MNKKKVILIIALTGVIIFAALFLIRGAIITTLAGKIALQAGRPLKFGSYVVLIDKVDGNKLYGIKVSSKTNRFIAKSGNYAYIPKENMIKFNLVDGVVEHYDPKNPRESHTLKFQQSFIKIKLKSSP